MFTKSVPYPAHELPIAQVSEKPKERKTAVRIVCHKTLFHFSSSVGCCCLQIFLKYTWRFSKYMTKILSTFKCSLSSVIMLLDYLM